MGMFHHFSVETKQILLTEKYWKNKRLLIQIAQDDDYDYFLKEQSDGKGWAGIHFNTFQWFTGALF